jgi:hypothetical protein
MPSRSHTQQLIDELIESYGHLKMAAGHVADGAAERVVPSYDRARDVATRGVSTTMGSISPLYEQVRDGAVLTRRRKRVSRKRRWPLLVGLLAAGTAAGAIGAIAARRRRTATQWDDYEPLPSIDDLAYGGGGSSQTATHKMTAGAAAMADGVSNQAGKIAESLHDKAGRGGSGNGRSSDNPLG